MDRQTEGIAIASTVLAMRALQRHAVKWNQFMGMYNALSNFS